MTAPHIRPTAGDHTKLGPISRRSLLLGAAGTVGLGVLAACSSSSDTTTDTSAGNGGDGTRSTSSGTAVLIATFDPRSLAVVGIENRLPLAIGGSDGVPIKDGPTELVFNVTKDGTAVGDPITVPRHNDGTPIGYYPLHFTPPESGTYAAETTIAGTAAQQAFQVSPADESNLLQPGQQMRSLATPTLADPLGTDPICTRKPEPCPLHDVNLTEALTGATPVALLFSTPEFCQTGVCGPVLALLLEQMDAHPDVEFIHCEIYQGNPNTGDAALVEAVEGYGLTYEPSLFVADANGKIVTRLDNVFDRVEIDQALTAAES